MTKLLIAVACACAITLKARQGVNVTGRIRGSGPPGPPALRIDASCRTVRCLRGAGPC